MNFAKSSSRMGSDYTVIKKIKNYLNIREKLLSNEPGRMVNGRELKAPSPKIKKIFPAQFGHKRNEATTFTETDVISSPRSPSGSPSQLQLNYADNF